MTAAIPDWRALELELRRLVRVVEDVAHAAGCSPQTVADAITETLDDETHPPRRPEPHLAGDHRRT